MLQLAMKCRERALADSCLFLKVTDQVWVSYSKNIFHIKVSITTLPFSVNRAGVGGGFSKLLPVLQFRGKLLVYSLDPSVMLLAKELPPAELHLFWSLSCCLLLAHWSTASSWELSLVLPPLRANSWDSFRRLMISRF